MFNLLLIGALSLAPGDTPIEPIPADIIELSIEAGIIDETCEAYAAVMPFVVDAFEGDRELATQVVDAFLIDRFEQGWDETGSAALTREARTVMLDYLHTCR